MSTQNHSIKIIDEIIDKASVLPIPYQEWLLMIAKNMVLFKKNMTEELLELELDSKINTDKVKHNSHT